MPRKASQKALNVDPAIARINQYCHQTSTSINLLASKVGVSQSALARFMSGERKTITEVAEKTLRYISNQHNWHRWHNMPLQAAAGSNIDGRQLIENSIQNLWDGNPITAEFIATFIQALKPALAVAIAAFGDTREGGES